jgi:hypothetical protein
MQRYRKKRKGFSLSGAPRDERTTAPARAELGKKVAHARYTIKAALPEKAQRLQPERRAAGRKKGK